MKEADPTVLPDAYHRLAPGHCRAEVDWDRSPTLFWNVPAGQVRPSYLFDDPEDSPDGITDMDDQIISMMATPSSGQEMIGKLQRIEALSKKPPNLDLPPKDHWNEVWEQNWVDQRTYLTSGPGGGAITILMDEPDVGLSIPNEYNLWTLVLPRLTPKHQVILATHSQMVPRMPLDFDVIELTTDYWETCRERLESLSPTSEHRIDSPDQEAFRRTVKANEVESRRQARKREKDLEQRARDREESDRRWNERHSKRDRPPAPL